MDDAAPIARSVVIEREVPHPPEKVWRALTQPHLIEEWLAKVDFRPVAGHRFNVQINPRPDKSFVFDCEVITVDPDKVLTYLWNSAGEEDGKGLRSMVTWHLTPTPNGTRLRMEQTGFQPDKPLYFFGAKMGWPQFVAKLEQLLARMN